MKGPVSIAVVVLAFAVTPSRAQTTTVGQRSPVDVVRDFMKIETSGGRLTFQGWCKASAFFIRPNFYPGTGRIHVILNDQANYAEETARAQNWAEVYAGMNEVGEIDEELRFEPSPPPPHGIKVKEGPSIRFDLVLTDKHWQLGPDGAMSRPITGPPEWKIVNESPELCITINAAVRYVAEIAAKTNDPAIRKNAGNALAALKRMQLPIVKDPPSACACF